MSAENLVLLKVGSRGSAPDDFYERVAQQHNATAISTEAVGERLGIHPDHTERSGVVGQEMLDQVSLLLRYDANVFYDGYINTLLYRQRLRERIAAESGALVITMALQADPKLRTARIMKKAGENTQDLTPTTKLTIARSRNMYNRAEWPWQQPVAEPHIRLNGTLKTEVLLEQLAAYVNEQQRTHTVA